MKNIKKFLLLFLLCVPCVFVQAEEVDKSSPSKEDIVIVEDADFKASDTLTTEGNFLGSVFYAGNNITSNSVVDGIGFLAGNNVTIEGEKEYLITAGNNIYVNGIIKKDAVIAGSTIHISGNIKRDVYIAGSSVVISGTIDRNVKIYASEITIKGNIKGTLEVNAGVINLEDTAVIEGYIKHNNNAVLNKSDNAVIGEVKLYTVVEQQPLGEYIKNVVYDLLTSYANLLIVALVLTYFLPKVFTMLKNEYSKIKVDTYFSLFAKGILFIIIVPVLAMFLLLSSVGLSLGVILLAIYFVLSYLSIILTGYLLGNLVLCKLLKKENNHYLNLLIGIAIIKILELIPFIGSFISITSLFIGLGIVSERILANRNRKQN